MFFAFLVLPHGSSLRSVRSFTMFSPGQPGRCLLFGSPAGSATAPRTHRPRQGAGGRSGDALFPAGLLHTRGRLAKKTHRALIPFVSLGAIFQSPQTPVGSFTCAMQARTISPQPPAYLTRENVRTAFLSFFEIIGFQAINC